MSVWGCEGIDKVNLICLFCSILPAGACCLCAPLHRHHPFSSQLKSSPDRPLQDFSPPSGHCRMREIIFHCWSGIFSFLTNRFITLDTRIKYSIRFATEQISPKIGTRRSMHMRVLRIGSSSGEPSNHCHITLKPQHPGRSVAAE